MTYSVLPSNLFSWITWCIQIQHFQHDESLKFSLYMGGGIFDRLHDYNVLPRKSEYVLLLSWMKEKPVITTEKFKKKFYSL